VADAVSKRGLESAWTGGSSGMTVTNRLLAQVDDLLSECGIFYLVAVKSNKISDVMKRMNAEYRLHGEVVVQRRAGREHLFVLRFHR